MPHGFGRCFPFGNEHERIRREPDCAESWARWWRLAIADASGFGKRNAIAGGGWHDANVSRQGRQRNTDLPNAATGLALSTVGRWDWGLGVENVVFSGRNSQ